MIRLANLTASISNTIKEGEFRMARALISKNATKSVYRDGDKAVKVFCKGFPKAEVLNEALISARVEAIGGINIPSVQAVSVEEDGCWSITRDYIEGKTLTELMKENPDKRDEYLNQMVELQLMIHSKTCPLLIFTVFTKSRSLPFTRISSPGFFAVRSSGASTEGRIITIPST